MQRQELDLEEDCKIRMRIVKFVVIRTSHMTKLSILLSAKLRVNPFCP